MKLVFVDTETTGLGDEDEPWEIGWIVRDLKNRQDWEGSVFVQHDVEKAKSLPPAFYADYQRRYDPDSALTGQEAGKLVQHIFAPAGVITRPHLIGSVPSFDTSKINPLLRRYGIASPWHYQIKCLESVALGHINALMLGHPDLLDTERAKLKTLVESLTTRGRGISSDELSMALGIDPAGYDRHTALGDCRWVRDQWDVMFPPDPEFTRVQVGQGPVSTADFAAWTQYQQENLR